MFSPRWCSQYWLVREFFNSRKFLEGTKVHSSEFYRKVNPKNFLTKIKHINYWIRLDLFLNLHFIDIFPVPTEKSTIMKENFNRWYSVKSYYISTMLIDLPISIISCSLFSIIIYIIVGWPMEACEWFLTISIKFILCVGNFQFYVCGSDLKANNSKWFSSR